MNNRCLRYLSTKNQSVVTRLRSEPRCEDTRLIQLDTIKSNRDAQHSTHMTLAYDCELCVPVISLSSVRGMSLSVL